jgi:signal transduction histidine kinase
VPIVIAVFIAAFFINVDAYEATYLYTREHEGWELDEIILVVAASLVAMPVGLLLYVIGQNTKLRKLAEDHKKLSDDLMETNERLIRASEAISEFVAMMSHEIRTPLTSIKGALGLARSDPKGIVPEAVKKLLDIAYRSTDRLSCLIDDILDYSKIEAGELEYRFEPLEVASLVELAVEANEGYGDQYSTKFVVVDDLIDARVNGDENRLMQAFSNLMSNAAKFFPAGSEVKISVVRHDGRIRFSVKDDGCGIPEVFRDQIFDRFTRADQSNTRTAGGTGLGLNITASIVKEHAGEIGFETEMDIGSTFYFDLPEYVIEEDLAAC